MSHPIELPDEVRDAFPELPDGPLFVASAYNVKDPERVGIWLGRRGEEHAGQRWPVTGLKRTDVSEWMKAAVR